MVDLVDLNAPKTEDTADDVFTKAFDMISAADAAATTADASKASDAPVGGPSPKTEEELKAEADAKIAADAAAAEAAKGTTLPPDDKEAAAAAAAEAAKVAAQAAPEMSDDELARRLASMIKKADPEPVADAKPQVQEPDVTAGMYTKEQMDFINKYNEEYPDIATAEQMKRRAEYAQLVQFVFTSVSKELRPRLEALEGLLTRTHLGDIQTAVPDYNATREGVIAWVGKQPDYIRGAYEQVVRRGTVEQVADLIKRFKSETSAPAPQAQVQENKEVAAKAASDAAALAKAAKSLAPVANKGTRATPSAISPTDFNAAFDMFKDAV